ncbi:MAG: protease inhibitor I42 family protein [Planctomycetota bacterium]
MLNRARLAAAASLAAALAGCTLMRGERSAGGILSIDVPAEAGNDLAPIIRSGTMSVGERLEVRLGAFGGSGYAWVLAGPTPANMQMTSADPAGAVKPAGSGGVPGGATWTTFGMTAIAQGEAKLRFELARPWEKDGGVKPARTAEVTVEVRPRQ